MEKHVLKIFKISNQGKREGDTPVYVIRDGQFFRTVFHPKGWSEMPDYRFCKDGKIYRIGDDADGLVKTPDYEFGRDMKMYRTQNHPGGRMTFPEYEVSD